MPTYTIFQDASAATAHDGQFTAQQSPAVSWATVIALNAGSNGGIGPTNDMFVFTSFNPAAGKAKSQYTSQQYMAQYDCSSIPTSETVTAVAFYYFDGRAGVTVTDAPFAVDILAYNWGPPPSTTGFDYRSKTVVNGLTQLATMSWAASAGPTSAYVQFTTSQPAFNSWINKGAGAAATQILIAGRMCQSNTPAPTGGNIWTATKPSVSPTKLVITTVAGGTPASGSGSLSLGGSVGGQGNATAAGSVVLGGSAAFVAPPAAGSVALGASVAGQVPLQPAGSVLLGASVPAQAKAAAAGGVLLSASAVPSPSAVGGAGSLLISGSVAVAASPAATGSVALSATVSGRAAPSPSPALSLGGSVGASVRAAATAVVNLVGHAAAANVSPKIDVIVKALRRRVTVSALARVVVPKALRRTILVRGRRPDA